MAVCATGIESSNMEIRVCMTRNTLGRKTCKLTGCMAGFTSDIDMRAVQGEVAEIMIECNFFPIGWHVTRDAVRPKAASMCIILLVTGVAIGGCALIESVLMACLANNFGVRPLKLESRKIVIELGRLPPVGYVTGSAVCTKARGMRIICAMTGVTILRCRLEIG